jgi:hypothetical protein
MLNFPFAGSVLAYNREQRPLKPNRVAYFLLIYLFVYLYTILGLVDPCSIR